MIIFIDIAILSIKVLYLTDEIFNVNLTVKALGHQWYWRYEFSDFSNIDFDSFIIPRDSYIMNFVFLMLITVVFYHINILSEFLLHL